MTETISHKLIKSHLVEGKMKPGERISIKIDQTLTQDATGTLVMLALEAMQLEQVQTEVSVQYVDHNLLQTDNKNPDDHLFLKSACQRFGLWFSRPGNGVSHPLHMSYFGKPGKTLLGSDSHTPAAGAMGMLAIGAGGIDVAMAMAGEPFRIKMPEIWGVKLTNKLPDWVSAKDVILEMLRRHGVSGGRGRIIEYYGPGLDALSVMDRHVIANMGTELGATSTVFPADDAVREFLKLHGRGQDFTPLAADEDANYDVHESIDLSALEPLIAKPSSPGNVVPVSELAGEDMYQAYIGSSANPGFRDFAMSAEIISGKTAAPEVSLDINPASRDTLNDLIASGHLSKLLSSGARIHQAGCNGCIGMGQAPATGRNSLRTVPRNFPDRSGTKEDSVFLCSPETATASAIFGKITDPRTLEMAYPIIKEPTQTSLNKGLFLAPLPIEEAKKVKLIKGPNVDAMPKFEKIPQSLTLPILLKVGDDVSTDEIMPAGSEILPFRSNIPHIAEFVFRVIDETYPTRAKKVRVAGGHAVVGGENYGQGSSREHAAVAPRSLGLRAVLVKSFARIHLQNLINYSVVPMVFSDKEDYNRLEQGDVLVFENLRTALENGESFSAKIEGKGIIKFEDHMSQHQREVLLAGGLINWCRTCSPAPEVE